MSNLTGTVFVNKGKVVGKKIGGGADEMTYTSYQALTSELKNDGSLRIVTEYPSPYDEGLIPNDYQQVEYIEATGDQYIDTGVSAPNGYRAKLDINFTAYNSDGSYGVVIGNYDNAPHRNFLGRGKNTVMLGVNGYTTVNNPMPNNNEWYDVEFCTTTDSSKKSYLKVGNTVAWENNGAIGGNTLCSDNLFLFQAKQTVYISAKVRSVKIYNSNDELVRDFVPCYRKTDSEVGLYDTVAGHFYTKARGSALLKGEDITSTGNLNVLIRNEVVVGQLTNIIDNDSKSGTRTWGADKLDKKFTENEEDISAINTNITAKTVLLTPKTNIEIVRQSCIEISNMLVVNALILTSGVIDGDIFELPNTIQTPIDMPIICGTDGDIKWGYGENKTVRVNGSSLSSGKYYIINFSCRIIQ